MSTDTLLSTAKLKMYAVCNGNTDFGVFFRNTKLEIILTEIKFSKRLFQLVFFPSWKNLPEFVIVTFQT